MIKDQQRTITGTTGELMDIGADEGLVAARRIWQSAWFVQSDAVTASI